MDGVVFRKHDTRDKWTALYVARTACRAGVMASSPCVLANSYAVLQDSVLHFYGKQKHYLQHVKNAGTKKVSPPVTLRMQ